MNPTLVGAKNFRSLKGLPARDGRRLGSHVLLRSDHLHDLTDADRATLAALGLRTVCDLRSAEERLRKPSRLPATGIHDLHLAVLADVRADPAVGAGRRKAT